MDKRRISELIGRLGVENYQRLLGYAEDVKRIHEQHKPKQKEGEVTGIVQQIESTLQIYMEHGLRAEAALVHPSALEGMGYVKRPQIAIKSMGDTPLIEPGGYVHQSLRTAYGAVTVYTHPVCPVDRVYVGTRDQILAMMRVADGKEDGDG